uniref:Zn(2)-C6 fungal-type domain-containing protein n=1 Tax=Kwoniella dejecticola CBS 10117 TaxID=1296121 RepID=A0A1A6AC74_9TREE|nr:uncharacterized protein I303_01879 [Kwoniella dejecticola CBS 10117]OBR87671.1 hypothetical protein I303_01879 [Kwoniella dejecticola CBS 10117]
MPAIRSNQPTQSPQSPSSSSTPKDTVNDAGKGAERSKSEPKSKATRSRNGCLVCRSRRLKCDLEKPECKRCVNYGAECVYPEKKAFDPNIVAEKLAKRHKRTSAQLKPQVASQAHAHAQGEPLDLDSNLNNFKEEGQDNRFGNDNPSKRIDPMAQSYLAPQPALTSISTPSAPFFTPQSTNMNVVHPNTQTQQPQLSTLKTSSTSTTASPVISTITTGVNNNGITNTGQPAWLTHPTHTVQQMDAVELLMALCRDTRMGQFFGGPLDPPEFLKKMFPVEEDLRCFHHALTYSLSILVVEEEPNPWVEHVARLFLVPTGEAPLSSEALKQGMLAMGAIHLSVLEARGSVSSSSGRTRELGLAYRWEAVKLLRQAKDIHEEVISDAFFAATVILNCDDVLGANPHWREVVRLGLFAVRKRGGCEQMLFPDNPYPDHLLSSMLPVPVPEKPVSPLLRCLIETMVISDVGSLSTGDPTVVLTDSSTWWERLAPTDPSEPDSCESTWGMHRSIPRLMTRVINLTWESQDLERQSFFDYEGDIPISQKKRWRESLKFRIHELRNDMASWIINVPQTIQRKRSKDGSLATWHAFQILILRDLLKVPRTDEMIQKSADTVLDICSQVGDKVEWMNFSLLITITALISPHQRQRAREVLRWFRVQCCYEIDVLESVAEECWKRIDDGLDDEACSWREILLEMGCSVLLG